MNKAMRVLHFLLSIWLTLTFVSCGATREYRASRKVQKKKEKDLKAEIQRRAIKEARKEAKKFRRQGYTVTPGSLPMDKMLEQTWMKLLERDENGEPVYIAADGNAVAQTRTAAEMQALEVAKLNLAGQLETIVRSIVEANIANAQLNTEEAASVTRVLQGAKNIIATRLERVDPVFKIYRNLPNKHVEVNVKILYPRRQAIETAKKAIKEKMEQDLEKIQDKLDKLLGLE